MIAWPLLAQALASLECCPNCPSVLPFDAVLSYYCYPVVLPNSRLPADAALFHHGCSLMLLNLHIKGLI
jgi:hypothetical protein